MKQKINTLKILTPTCESQIYCGFGAFERYTKPYADQKVFVITDDNVLSIYGDLIKTTFQKGYVYAIKSGEKHKNHKTLIAILQEMIACGLTRKSTVIAFGGGVVGDVAGLCASVYMRGIKLVQIPTTLLSQVDSSVGGKTAIDLGNVKNVIGTFYQPQEVIVDPTFLKTLPHREIKCGLGEIIKYGALDGEIFANLSKNVKNLFSLDYLSEIIFKCIQFKADVVSQDEKETLGLRKILNLGHTTGHAFELYYAKKSHGEYVLIGAYYELFIAQKLGLCSDNYASALRSLIKRVINKIPAPADVEKSALLAMHDKKNSVADTISIIVPTAIGKTQEVVMPISDYVAHICECRDTLKVNQ